MESLDLLWWGAGFTCTLIGGQVQFLLEPVTHWCGHVPAFCTRAMREPPPFWCLAGLNPQPTVYQTAALTTEPLTNFHHQQATFQL